MLASIRNLGMLILIASMSTSISATPAGLRGAPEDPEMATFAVCANGSCCDCVLPAVSGVESFRIDEQVTGARGELISISISKEGPTRRLVDRRIQGNGRYGFGGCSGRPNTGNSGNLELISNLISVLADAPYALNSIQQLLAALGNGGNRGGN